MLGLGFMFWWNVQYRNIGERMGYSVQPVDVLHIPPAARLKNSGEQMYQDASIHCMAASTGITTKQGATADRPRAFSPDLGRDSSHDCGMSLRSLHPGKHAMILAQSKVCSITKCRDHLLFGLALQGSHLGRSTRCVCCTCCTIFDAFQQLQLPSCIGFGGRQRSRLPAQPRSLPLARNVRQLLVLLPKRMIVLASPQCQDAGQPLCQQPAICYHCLHDMRCCWSQSEHRATLTGSLLMACMHMPWPKGTGGRVKVSYDLRIQQQSATWGIPMLCASEDVVANYRRGRVEWGRKGERCTWWQQCAAGSRLLSQLPSAAFVDASAHLVHQCSTSGPLAHDKFSFAFDCQQPLVTIRVNFVCSCQTV